jgi:hypothetical protein
MGREVERKFDPFGFGETSLRPSSRLQKLQHDYIESLGRTAHAAESSPSPDRPAWRLELPAKRVVFRMNIVAERSFFD